MNDQASVSSPQSHSSTAGSRRVCPLCKRHATRRRKPVSRQILPGISPSWRNDHEGEDKNDAESEKGDRDGEEGEVVIEDDREDAGEGELEEEGRERGQGDAQIHGYPVTLLLKLD